MQIKTMEKYYFYSSFDLKSRIVLFLVVGSEINKQWEMSINSGKMYI